MAISPQRLTVYLYSAHRAVIFAIAQLSYLILVVNVVCELQQKRTLAASRGFLAAARLSCFSTSLEKCAWNLRADSRSLASGDGYDPRSH